MDTITNGNLLRHLYYLLVFLATWKERPTCLAQIAYKWCSAISEVAVGRFGQGEIPVIEPQPPQDELKQKLKDHEMELIMHQIYLRLQPAPFFVRSFQNEPLPLPEPPEPGLGLRFQLRQQDPGPSESPDPLSRIVEEEFSEVGPACDLVYSDDASCRAHRGQLESLTPLDYAHFLSITLEVGFRLATPDHGPTSIYLSHSVPHQTSHHDWIYKIAFSSHDDELVADAMYAWVADEPEQACLCAHYFTKRVEWDAPFSPRLQQASICAIRRVWYHEHDASGLEIIQWLNRLDVDVDDVDNTDLWVLMLVDMIHFPTGMEVLSSHHWTLLGNLVLAADGGMTTTYRNWEEMTLAREAKVMRSLREAEDWDKLGVWMMAIWVLMEDVKELGDIQWMENTEWMMDIFRVTLELLSQRPTGLAVFEAMYERKISEGPAKTALRLVCERAREDQLAAGPSLSS